jgi:outer membrane protein
MYMKKIVLLSAILFFSGSLLTAQNQKKDWTLEACIEYALENNIGVKRYELAKENQEITVETTRFSRLPDLSANVGQTFYFGRTPDRDGIYQDQTGSNSSLGINTSVNLFSGFQVTNQLKSDKLELQAAVEDLNRAKEDLSLAVTGYYLQVLLSRELYEIALDQLELNRKQVEQTKILVEAGKSSESDFYDARSSLAQQEMQVTESANNLQLALLDLTQTMNLPDVEHFDVALPDISEMISGEAAGLVLPAQVYLHSVKERPAIKAAEYRLEGSEMSLKSAKGAYYPSLRLGAGYSNSYYYNYSLAAGMSNASLADQWAQNSAQSIGLSLSVPLFNRMATRNRVRSARLNIQNQELLLNQAKQDLYKEVQQAYYNAVAAHEKYKSSEMAVEAASLAYEFEEQKYEAGRSNIYTFDQVRLRLSSARSEAAQAKYNFLFRSRILAFYNGVNLF